MFKKRHPHVGARPGTLVFAHDALPTRVRLIQYAHDDVREEIIDDATDIEQYLDDATVTWINVCGLGDGAVLQVLADLFSIHPLAMEDVVNVPQRPKSELYGDQQLIICHAVRVTDQPSIKDEQISLLIGPNYVITFQEDYSDPLSSVNQRIHIADSRLRQGGSDYLAYAIMDAIIDAYYPVLETLGEHLEQLEDHIIDHPHPALLQQLNSIRRQLSQIRRAISPKRELIRSLIHDENPLFGDQSRLFLRDTHDHTLQVSEVVDTCRESVTSLMNSYISAVGHRTNEVMKVLTIMSSIFVPLTFLAGIYGMNFEYMPELQVRWAYPMIWVTMLGCVATMLIFFRRKGWLGRRTANASLAQLLTDTRHRATLRDSSQAPPGEGATSRAAASLPPELHFEPVPCDDDAPNSRLRVRRAS